MVRLLKPRWSRLPGQHRVTTISNLFYILLQGFIVICMYYTALGEAGGQLGGLSFHHGNQTQVLRLGGKQLSSLGPLTPPHFIYLNMAINLPKWENKHWPSRS